jgi:hypothetical protein
LLTGSRAAGAGVGIGGVIAAVLLLVMVLKRWKKKHDESRGNQAVESGFADVTDLEEGDDYMSEYGLSDGCRRRQGRPQVDDDGFYRAAMSDHNPQDLSHDVSRE